MTFGCRSLRTGCRRWIQHDNIKSRDWLPGTTLQTSRKVRHTVRNFNHERPAKKAKHTDKGTSVQRDFFFDVLNVNATRRDAKQYLSRFKDSKSSDVGPSRKSKAFPTRSQDSGRDIGVNLGPLYAPTRASQESPVFRHQTDLGQSSTPGTGVQKSNEPDHVALVSVRSLDDIDDDVLNGVAITLSQLVRLDMRIVVVLDDARNHEAHPFAEIRRQVKQQADRLVDRIVRHNAAGSQYIDSSLSVLGVKLARSTAGVGVDDPAQVYVGMPDLLFHSIRQGRIPVIPAIAYTQTCKAVPISRSAALMALTRYLSGLDRPDTPHEQREEKRLSLDRLLMIDPLGGTPSSERQDGAHVFVNLDQEMQHIRKELSRPTLKDGAASSQHLRNLEDINRCLSLLPPTSSALILSPEEAAGSKSAQEDDTGPGSIRTRRQKNPLIHNLLTNRPVISSSLPAERITALSTSGKASSASVSCSTLVKRGMPVMMVPDPRTTVWKRPVSGQTDLQLEKNPHINFSRLLALIEDSFRRPMNVEHYLNRIEHRVAGIIVAGEYEGGAILTWESPPGSDDPTRLVPYLDKFAVLQKSQGNAGVADIVFQAMVRSCFPNGVVWRSRSDNPVNKWYFERSVGSWKLPGGQWTMFWTTPNEDLLADERRWQDYVDVCSGVQPSWADGKRAD